MRNLINKGLGFITVLISKGLRFITVLINRIILIKKINIGGGPAFFGTGWINLDAVDSMGSHRILFSPESRFPFRDSSIDFVYSSHCFEHLDDETVDKLLSESYRVLNSGEKILIKIPDFDGIQAEYRKQNFSFLKSLGQDSVFWTWAPYGVKVDIYSCYSMMICGYWNNEYGDHFSGKINVNNIKAYHGPALLSDEEITAILAMDDVRVISKTLNEYALADKDFKQFNHQNAWSFQQFKDLLVKHGFSVIKMTREEILTKYNDVPKIRTMANWSMFILAEK
jgi:hypothetical protein